MTTTFSTTRIANFVVTLSAASTQTVTINYATKDVTAVGGVDYETMSGTLTFAPGELTKTIAVPLSDTSEGALTFDVDLSTPVNCTLGTAYEGVGTIGIVASSDTYLDRFNWAYNTVKLQSNGYFGPTTGSNAYQCPYHAPENAIIVEAPDWCHESVSETISFWFKMETWKTILSNDTTGLTACWNSMEANYIPSATVGQVWCTSATYQAGKPASYAPDATSLSLTPVDYNTTITVGNDPLSLALYTAYNTMAVYLMHWLYDVDGAYGFHGADGTTKIMAPINNYQRGPVEDGLATITHACYEDYNNGGQPVGSSGYGFLPIYDQANPPYTSSTNPFTYSQQWTYSVAPDAEARVVSAIWGAKLASTAAGITPLLAKAKKMADYTRYSFYDKYFQPIKNYAGTTVDGAGCHYLLSWGCGYGGGIIESPATVSYWGFRIGNSECHNGYNSIDMAYACSQDSTLMSATPWGSGSQTAASQWAISLDRQLEFVRWLQSPLGPIAGGATSNWKGVYGTPTDARVNAQFYGMNYTYSPSWHNPPSNNWTGYQAWGMGKISALYVALCQKTDSVSVSYVTKCGVILDLWVQWFVNSCSTNTLTGVMSYPSDLRWTVDSPGGYASTVATAAGDYELLPTLNWGTSTDNYSTFWGTASVPNPNLVPTVIDLGWDSGTAAGFAQVLIQYAYAKSELTGSLTGVIPNGTSTFQQVLQKAQDMMEIVWWSKDSKGFGSVGNLAIPRLNDQLWIPTQFGTGAMPNGEVLQHGVTTFASARHSLYSVTQEWAQLNTYLAAVLAKYPSTTTLVINNDWTTLNADLKTIAADTTLPTPPSINYHRFWNQADVACAFAMLNYYFPTLATPTGTYETSVYTAVALAVTNAGSTTTTQNAAIAAALASITTSTSSSACKTAVTAALTTMMGIVTASGATAGVVASAIATTVTAVFTALLL